MGLFYFKAPRHRVFNYQPVTYDIEKERRERRRAELSLTNDTDAEGEEESGEYKVGSIIRNGGMRARHQKFDTKYSLRKSWLRLVFLIMLITAIVYFLVHESMHMLLNN